jgi:hypothetical protein
MLSLISYWGLVLRTEYGETSIDLLLTSGLCLGIFNGLFSEIQEEFYFLFSEILDEFIAAFILNEFSDPVFIPSGRIWLKDSSWD